MRGRGMRKLFTIGYEGVTLDAFIHTLEEAKIDLLLDVRELPASRRKGFSKTALSTALAEAGIAYRHEKCLGTPKAVRHRLREDRDYDRFFRDFDRHLSQQSALMERLGAELKGNVALMCFERDAALCHRHRVAAALGERLHVVPTHLRAPSSTSV